MTPGTTVTASRPGGPPRSSPAWTPWSAARWAGTAIPGVLCSMVVLALAAVGCGGGPGAPADDAGPAATSDAGATATDPGAATEGMAGEEHDHEHVSLEDLPGEPFEPDLLGSNVYGITFAPDGTEAFFVKIGDDLVTEQIHRLRATDGGWSEPETATFSGRWPDKEPYFSPDGDRIFFASKRPTAGDAARDDFDIWVVERDGDGWGDPVPVSGVNTSAPEDYPAISSDGTLFFVREGQRGNRDIWVAEPAADGWREPWPLERPVNTSYPEADPWVAPDGDFLIFTSVRIHDDAEGAGDLWVTFRRGDGWSELVGLGTAVNSGEHEYAPALSPDGTVFYFSRGLMPVILSVPVAEIEVLSPGS